MQSKRNRVSIVIPAYNEESHLQACLEAIAAQTVKPYEVIVVDNNSTDRTADVAASFPFVTVLTEKRRGVVYARDAGFDAARGDIIGRIDVDSLLSPEWVATLESIFSDPTLDAVSGSISFNDVPFKRLFAGADSLIRHYLARNLARRGELFLYGGNMAIRKAAWLGVRNEVCHLRRFHEDIDLAAHFAHSNYQLAFYDQLHASVSARRIDSPARDYYPYVIANSRTYAAHGLRGRFYMYPVELLVMALFVPLRLLYRSYDQTSGTLSLRRMVAISAARRTSPVSEAS